MFTHDVKKINEFLKELKDYNDNFWDYFKMDAKDCKPTYPCRYEESKKRLDDVLFDLTAKYVHYYYDRDDGTQNPYCNVQDFKLSEQLNLLACYIEHEDFNDNTIYYFQQNIGNLLRNVTVNNILDFTKNLLSQMLEEHLESLQKEVDYYLSEHFCTYNLHEAIS